MLRIGDEEYEVVEAQTGLHANVDPVARDWRRQWWRMELCFVARRGLRAPWEAGQVWRLAVNPVGFLKVADWRELDGRSWFEDGLVMVSRMNLCEGSGGRVHDVVPGECRAVRRNGTLFTLELDGEVEPADGYEGPTGELRALVEMPFSSIHVSVPANAADPVSAARAVAARELRWQGRGRTHWSPYNPEQTVGGRLGFRASHKVWLEVAGMEWLPRDGRKSGTPLAGLVVGGPFRWAEASLDAGFERKAGFPGGGRYRPGHDRRAAIA